MRDTPRSSCPLACTLDLVGDRWTLLVLRDLLSGAEHFDQLLASAEGIATNVLAERLKRLQAERMLSVEQDAKNLRRKRYRLTPRGRSFAPVLAAVAMWGLRNIPGTAPDPRVAQALEAAIPRNSRRARGGAKRPERT